MQTLISLQKQLSHNCPLKQVTKKYNGKYFECKDAYLNGSTVTINYFLHQMMINSMKTKVPLQSTGMTEILLPHDGNPEISQTF